MQRLEYTMMLIVIVLCCAAAGPATASMPAAAESEADQLTVGLTFVEDMDGKSPQAKATVFFAYYEPETSEWQASSEQTDSTGRCSFQVPKGDAGESFTFLFAMAKEKLDEGTKAVSDGKRPAWRIPPGDQQVLELLTDGSRVSNTKGTVQMWGVR